jgi:hypothetical protein
MAILIDRGGIMHREVLHTGKLSFLRTVVAALFALAALPGLALAQRINAPTVPASSAVSSAVPQIIQFSGQLSETAGGSGAPVPSGTVSVTFTLYQDEEGGTALWSETDNVQVNAQGNYTALLGSASPDGLPLNLFTTGQAHWLAVQPLLQGFAGLPRVLLVSAPYALKARDAETIGGLPPSAFVLAAPPTSPTPGLMVSSTGAASLGSPALAAGRPADPQLSGSGTTNYIPIWTSSTALGNSKIYQTGGNLGIGKTTPAWALDVNGFINTNAAYKIGQSTVLALPGGVNEANIAIGFDALANNTVGDYNMASGYQALYENTSGYANTASGAQALALNTTGNSNTGIGSGVLFNNTTGDSNTATGSEALNCNVAGNYNTASGATALYRNYSGGYNTADGAGALPINVSGSSNTAIGYSALAFSGTGSNNTAVGYESLYSLGTGSSNIAIGYEAAYDVSSGNSDIEIGNSGSSGDNGVIRIGTSGTQTAFYVAGIYGVTLPTAGQPLVCIDSAGQLGTANCATEGAPSAQREVTNLQRQVQTLQEQNEQFRRRIETLQNQNDESQRRLSRLESVIAKN